MQSNHFASRLAHCCQVWNTGDEMWNAMTKQPFNCLRNLCLNGIYVLSTPPVSLACAAQFLLILLSRVTTGKQKYPPSVHIWVPAEVIWLRCTQDCDCHPFTSWAAALSPVLSAASLLAPTLRSPSQNIKNITTGSSKKWCFSTLQEHLKGLGGLGMPHVAFSVLQRPPEWRQWLETEEDVWLEKG